MQCSYPQGCLLPCSFPSRSTLLRFFFKHPVTGIRVRTGWAKSLEASSRKTVMNQEKSSVVMNVSLMGAIWRPVLHKRCMVCCCCQQLCSADVGTLSGNCCVSSLKHWFSLTPERVVAVRVFGVLEAIKTNASSIFCTGKLSAWNVTSKNSSGYLTTPLRETVNNQTFCPKSLLCFVRTSQQRAIIS